jgi:DNA-directed RNA polymerase subunit M
MCTLDHKARCYKCPKCGAEQPMEAAPVIQRASRDDDKIVVIGKKEQNIKTMSQVKAKCPKCENDMAYWWMVQTRSIDESTTQFYRCTKCGYTWRDYS